MRRSGSSLVIALVVLMLIALQTIMPLADTVTMAAVQARGLDYGRIRLWGSLTFIVGELHRGLRGRRARAGGGAAAVDRGRRR